MQGCSVVLPFFFTTANFHLPQEKALCSSSPSPPLNFATTATKLNEDYNYVVLLTT